MEKRVRRRRKWSGRKELASVGGGDTLRAMTGGSLIGGDQSTLGGRLRLCTGLCLALAS